MFEKCIILIYILDNSVPEQNLVYESVFGIPQSYETRPLPTRTTTNDVPEESLLDSLCSDSDNVPDRPITAFEKFLATKVHILLLSILTYMSIYSEILIIPVFIPFILSEISEVILFHRQTEKPGLLYLLFLNKVSKTKINTIVNVFHIINKICNDFAIYMLTFILMHAFISLFDDT